MSDITNIDVTSGVTTYTDANGTTWHDITTDAAFNRLQPYLKKIETLTDVKNGGEYWVHNDYSNSSTDTDPLFHKNYYLFVGQSDIKFSWLPDFSDGIEDILLGLAIAGIVGLIFFSAGWSLIIIAILLYIAWKLLKKGYNNLANQIKNTFHLPDNLSKEASAILIILFALLFLFLLYEFKKGNKPNET